MKPSKTASKKIAKTNQSGTKSNKQSEAKTLMLKALPTSQVRRICDPEQFNFKSTEKLPHLKEIVGQDRAVHALVFGLEMKDHGYHVYAVGPMGTGKATTIRKYLEKEAKNKPVPNDWLYINNFDDTDKPKKLQLPAGIGRKFRDDMDKLVLELKTEVPKAFEAEAYTKEREAVEKNFQNQSDELLQQLAKKAEERGFQLVQTSHGFAVVPMVEDKVLTPKAQLKLNEEKRKELEANQEVLLDEVHDLMRRFDQLQKDARDKLQDLDRRVVGFAVAHMIDALKKKYKTYEAIISFLVEVHDNLLKNVPAFKQLKQIESIPPHERMLMMGKAEPLFEEYKVNLLIDNHKAEGAPVIFEKNPAGPNLIGRIEQQGWLGTLVTNFRMIKAGALHHANGGYLILNILDVLKKPYAWEVLKRALKNREVVIESMIESLGGFSTRTLEPEAIPLDIKVILIGNPMFYYMIYEYDPEFKELFKVKADFAAHMDWTEQSAYQYAQFISMVCQEEKLKHFTPEGVAKIVEYGSRLVDHQKKITTQFGDIVDAIRQSVYWAGKNGNDLVMAEDVQKALDEKIYRSNRIEELIRQMIEEKTIKINTEGEAVGKINGLAVLSLGDYSFGKPSVISSRVFVGGAGIVSIERETDLGGKIHNKAAMIITSYLGGRYAQNVPLAFSASITFEQVYEAIEGDSASAAEIYVLLSTLSGYPLRQDLAITGSVNQHGEVQAIGGVNEKIEGFFHVCKIAGLTGTQGVIIPESNVQHLMLHEDVIDAIKKGKFYIYAISNIDEGIALLTGKPAGEIKSDGSYPKGTVNFAVQQRIVELANKAKNFGVTKKNNKK